VVHAVGYGLYRRQELRTAAKNEYASLQRGSTESIRDPYRCAIKAAIIQQIAILTLTATILDGGFVFRVACISTIAHWTSIGLILFRRLNARTKFDLIVIKYGFLPISFIAGRIIRSCGM